MAERTVNGNRIFNTENNPRGNGISEKLDHTLLVSKQ